MVLGLQLRSPTLVALLQVVTPPAYKQNLVSDLQRNTFLPGAGLAMHLVWGSLSTRTPEAKQSQKPGECGLRQQRAWHSGIRKPQGTLRGGLSQASFSAPSW